MWKQQRQKSYFYNMRKYHNYVKRHLYQVYTSNKNVLELCCGKGGDLPKLFDNNVKQVTCYDKLEISIHEAKKRLESFPLEFQNKVFFNVLDLSIHKIESKITFDVCSCMFALHYFFESQETFENIICSIKDNLKIGGIFMGTFFDGDSVIKRLKTPFTDSHFNITNITGTESTTGSTLFGNKIKVSYNETIENCEAIYNAGEEYLVDFTQFVNIMRSHKFELIATKMFKEIYNPKFKMSNTEKDVSFLNRYFVFIKN